MKKLIAIVLMITLAGCSSVTIRTDSQREASAPPSFEQRYTYWWWGLKGEYSVNVREVCRGNPVEQMQAVHSIVDTFSALFTLGIYSPRTARVWCEEA